MSTQNLGQEAPKFGTGQVIGESFTLFFRNIVKVAVIIVPFFLLSTLINLLLFDPRTALGLEEALDNASLYEDLVTSVIQLATYALSSALLVLFVFDARAGKARPLSAYFIPVLTNALPLIVLTFVALLALVLGMIALVLPGLWIYAALSVTLPVVVIEGAGFSSLSRSYSLTKGYRWPIVAVVFVLGVTSTAISSGAAYLIARVADGTEFFLLLWGAGMAVINVLEVGLSAIGVALIYARLLEIKEAPPARDLAEVFS